jgi:response regulator of citrate/malate metabolism
MFHRGKSVDVIAQTHNISIQRVNKIISNQTGMSNTKTHPRQLRGKAFNAKVKAYANQGLSFNDIASIMGCSYSTIKRSFDDTKPKKKSKPVAKKIHVPTKSKDSNKRTSSFSILWGAISFSRTSTMND